jgi:hypothetical protein
MNKNCEFLEIESIEVLEQQEDVYDITVDETHNFFADGILVHNCVGGYPSGLIYSEFPGLKFNELSPALADDPAVMRKLVGKVENAIDRFVDCVGKDNFFLETQFHAIDAQDFTNRVLIETSKKTGIPLIATADSHFPGPELWEAREMYRMLQPGRIKNDGSVPMLPKKEELKALLYPKNADQMWQEFLQRREKFDWYHGQEDVVRTAIETGYDVVWDKCEQVWFDTSAKLPSFDTAEKSSFSQLCDLVKEALKSEGLDDKPEYIKRAKMELLDIKYLKFSDYFLTLQKVFKLAENRTLPGAGRGSGAGSLVNYLLGITHVDPIKYGLLWERFLHRNKAGWPDVDCLHSAHLVKTPEGEKTIGSLVSGDEIFDANGYVRIVNFTCTRNPKEDENVFDIFLQNEDGEVGVITASENHRLLLCDGTEIQVRHIAECDMLFASDGYRVTVMKKVLTSANHFTLVDISVDTSSTFTVAPFSVAEISKKNETIFRCIHTYTIDTDVVDEWVKNAETSEVS